jgi:hypothetical protein
MNSKRVMFYNEHIGGSQYRLRIRNKRGDAREWWKYDAKRRTIHIANNRNRVISNEMNQGAEKGKRVVMAPYKNSVQSVFYDGRSQRIHNGKNQKWQIAYKPGTPKNTGFKSNKRIRIRSKMAGGRVVSVMNHIGRSQYRTVI